MRRTGNESWVDSHLDVDAADLDVFRAKIWIVGVGRWKSSLLIA